MMLFPQLIYSANAVSDAGVRARYNGAFVSMSASRHGVFQGACMHLAQGVKYGNFRVKIQ
jgi:hypothetical protein